MTTPTARPADTIATEHSGGQAGEALAKTGSEMAIESLETQLSLLWRRARSINYGLTRSVHPELEPAAYGLLSVLMIHGGMRLTDLAKSIGVGKPSVSRQITFLAGLGLVSKVADPGDGRAQVIELTEKGRAQMHEVHAARQEAFRRMLEHWDEADVTSLAALIAKLNNEYGQNFGLRED
jgi:DNA-binding MarR family transcriptional regulator